MQCSVCYREKDRMWSNKALLGTEDVLCLDCFSAWYGGLTSKDAIRDYVLGEDTLCGLEDMG